MRESDPKGSDGLTARESGVWVREKLYYLEHYLDIFSVGMKRKWPGKLYYIDLFAGPGKCLIRETQEEIDGSPLIALKFNFAQYIFFESEPEFASVLGRRVRARAPDKDVQIIRGDCNKEIDRLQPPAGLGVAFIDPTNISSLAFETIRTMAANRKIDLIINFNEGMGIRMNIHQHTKKEEGGALDRFMGSRRWREDFKSAPASIDEVCRKISGEYRENLRKIEYLVVDGDQIPVRADKNRLLYYLLFASKNPRGNEFWQKIGLIGPHGQRRLDLSACEPI